jgi:hypothetical protein
LVAVAWRFSFGAFRVVFGFLNLTFNKTQKRMPSGLLFLGAPRAEFARGVFDFNFHETQKKGGPSQVLLRDQHPALAAGQETQLRVIG